MPDSSARRGHLTDDTPVKAHNYRVAYSLDGNEVFCGGFCELDQARNMLDWIVRSKDPEGACIEDRSANVVALYERDDEAAEADALGRLEDREHDHALATRGEL